MTVWRRPYSLDLTTADFMVVAVLAVGFFVLIVFGFRSGRLLEGEAVVLGVWNAGVLAVDLWHDRRVSSNVVNLNRFRKKKQREEKAKQAEINRIRHGRTQAEKDRERRERKAEHEARKEAERAAREGGVDTQLAGG